MVAKRAWEAAIDNDFTLGPGETGIDISRILSHPHAYALSLKGYLTPGWSGRLAAGLAEHEIDIVRGEAEKVSAISWRSTFEIKAERPQGDPMAIDYVALAKRELPLHHKPPVISLKGYQLERSKRDGSIFVEVHAVDRTGFLRDLLDYFSLKCLFPVKMRIDTLGGQVFDQFWLKGMGGTDPAATLSEALDANLSALCES